MYRLATILLIGSAAALTLKKNETVDMAQVNATTYDPSVCEMYCHVGSDGGIACNDS